MKTYVSIYFIWILLFVVISVLIILLVCSSSSRAAFYHKITITLTLYLFMFNRQELRRVYDNLCDFAAKAKIKGEMAIKQDILNTELNRKSDIEKEYKVLLALSRYKTYHKTILVLMMIKMMIIIVIIHWIFFLACFLQNRNKHTKFVVDTALIQSAEAEITDLKVRSRFFRKMLAYVYKYCFSHLSWVNKVSNKKKAHP